MNSFWKNKKVFITGANGFLGSHLTLDLIKHGARPVVLIYEPNPGGLFDLENLYNKTDVVYGNVCDLNLIEEIIHKYKIDSVFHLAAQAIVDQALEDPLETFEANIKGTWNMLEVAKKSGKIERLIVASSDKAYGDHDTLPYEEDEHDLYGSYPYEVSKVCADLITQSFYKTFGVPVCITRCVNFYGPGDLKMNRIVPRTIERLFNNQCPIIRNTGESLRDYLYVEDAAKGYRLLAEKMNDDLHGHAFNFATNRPLSVAEVIKIICREMGKNIEPVVEKTHGMEIRHQYASYDKANKLLQWQPEHSFEEGLRKTIPWYISHLSKNSTSVKKNERQNLLSR